MPTASSKGRKVKSAPICGGDVADRHERAKDYLSPTEVAKLLDAAKAGRHGVRDHLLLLMTYRHGLRVSESIALRRDELDLDRARLWVRRLKGGLSVEQPIAGDELRAIKRYLATRADALPWLFVSERDQPLTRQGVNYLVATAAKRAGLAGGPPPYAAPFLRLRSCGQRTRFASDPGLSRPPRSPAHCALHPHRRASFRGAMAMSARAGHDLSGIMKWCAREDWRPRVDAVMAEHFEPAMKAFGLDFQEIGEALGETWAVTLGCAFEDFLTRRFGPGDENPVQVYLRRRGWKEPVTARTYMTALRTSLMSLYEASDIIPGQSFRARDLVRGGDPVLVSERTATRTLKTWDRIAARIVEHNGKMILAGGLLSFTLEASEGLFSRLRDLSPDAGARRTRQSRGAERMARIG